MNFFPLCTASVWPTISGTTVDRRDQVLMTFLSAPRFITSTFSSRWVSMNGPFFSERPIVGSRLSALGCAEQARRLPRNFRLFGYFDLRCTMNLSVALRLRVLYPFVGRPQGDTGCRPPDVLPSPPPSG